MIYYSLAAVVVLLVAVGQVLLKIGSRKKGNKEIYLNPATLMGYIIFLSATLCSVYALKEMDLKTFYALMSLNPLAVMVLSAMVLRETFTRNKLIAVGLIFIGLLVFNL